MSAKGGPSRLSTDLAELIGLGESETLEFKSSARWNYKAKQFDKKLEQMIVKTVCGFMNHDGGTLLIGVNDDGSPVGLQPDYGTLGAKGDRDGFELFLHQRLDADLSLPTAGLVRTRFELPRGRRSVCRFRRRFW